MLPHPIFSVFGKDIYMYGICIAVGLICCLLAFFYLSKKGGMSSEVQDYIFFVLIGGVAMGFFFAKLFQAFYDFVANGWKDFDFQGAGLTVMGGLIGGASCFLLLYFLIGHFYFRGKKKENLHIKDFNTLIRVAPISICIAHGFGRIGCLMSGCCHGAYLGSEFTVGGLMMEGTTNGYGCYVPTQLFEALFLFVLAGVLTVLYFKRVNVLMSIYLVGYAIWRFIIERFRTDYRGGTGALTPSQWQSIVFILIAAAIIVFMLIKKVPLILPKKETVQKQEDTQPEVKIEE